MYKIAIVNPPTLVGTEIKTILRERSFPASKVALLGSTGKDTGALPGTVLRSGRDTYTVPIPADL